MVKKQKGFVQLEDNLNSTDKHLRTSLANVEKCRRVLQRSKPCIKDSDEQNSAEQKIRCLESWIDQLQQDFDSFQQTKRWRLGNLIINILKGDFRGNKKPGVLLHAQRIFNEFNAMRDEVTPKDYHQISGDDPAANPALKQLLQLLENDITALANCTRYKAGDLIARIPGIILFHDKPRLAMDHMKEILNSCHLSGDEDEIDTKELIAAIDSLQEVFETFLTSNRWKIGTSLFRIPEIFLLRKKKPMATDHIKALFLDFETNRLDYLIQTSKESGQNNGGILRKIVSTAQATGEPYELPVSN